jgi:CBS domain-containing protein
MTIRDILQVKGSDVYTTTPQTTLEKVVEVMVERNCGSLVVVDRPDSLTLVGIITERDILRNRAARTTALDKVLVGDAMSMAVVTASLGDEVPKLMGLMTKNRFRHMPVVEDGKLVGIISIGDVVKSQHDALTMENHYLKNYIQS